MTSLNDLSETMTMKGERPQLSEDQKRALPVIALALRGDKDALHYIGLYDPEGREEPAPDFEADLLKALQDFKELYGDRFKGGSPRTEAFKRPGE